MTPPELARRSKSDDRSASATGQCCTTWPEFVCCQFGKSSGCTCTTDQCSRVPDEPEPSRNDFMNLASSLV